MKSKYFSLALALAFLAPGLWAQSPSGGKPAAADPPVIKIAVLDVRAAIVTTAEGKQAAAEMQSQFSPRRNELETLSKKIEDLGTRLRSGERTLSDEEKDRLQREGAQWQKQLQRKQQELEDDANEAQNEVVNRLGRKVMEVLDRYARDNGFSVVLDKNSQSSAVLYANNAADITQEIIRLYDATYPVKGGAAPAKPAAGQSSAPPAARPPAVAPATKPPASSPGTKPPQH